MGVPTAMFGAPPPPPPPPRSGAASPLGSQPGSARQSALLGANFHNLLNARKDISITPSIKMKQLQWDKLPQQQVTKTVFSDETQTEKENEWIKKFQMDGIWSEMEEDFKAKQLVINLMGEPIFLS